MSFIRFLLLPFFLLSATFLFAQPSTKSKYWIYLEAKDTSGYDYTKHLSNQTLINRKLQNLPLWQYSDIPLNQEYIDLLASKNIYPICKSKWLNAVSVSLSDKEYKRVEEFDFVVGLRPIKGQLLPTRLEQGNKKEIGKAMQQLELDTLKAQQLTGKNITIGVIDAGFYESHKSDLLKHLDKTTVLGMRDYVNPKQKDLFREKETAEDTHGTTVLEMISGYEPEGRQVGAATDAKFYLARTDHGVHETRSEEDYWVAAMEWMDSLGVKLINTSLGYTVDFDNQTEDYKPAQMDGHTSVVSKAIQTAFNEKGILVVVSAGNEGWDRGWQIVSTPGDSPYALSVGATNAAGLKMGYSSQGADFVDFLKPNVACYSLSGTSFSAPNITGFAACLWQAKPKASNKEIYEVIEKSATLYPHGNNYVGYGIPKASVALALLKDSAVNQRNSTPKFKVIKAKKDKIKLKFPPKKRILIFHKKDKRFVINQFSTLSNSKKRASKMKIKRLDKNTKYTTIYVDEAASYEIEWK